MKKRAWWPTFLLIIILAALFLAVPAFAAGQPGEYLNYQEPKPAGTSWLSTLAYVFSLLVTFALVLGLAYFTSRFLGQKMGNLTAAGDNRVVLNLPLGPKRAVYVVEIAGKVMVLGVTDHNVNLLHEITDPEQLEKLKNAQPSVMTTNQFDVVFQKHLASLQQMSNKFPGVFGNNPRSDNENEREKR
jgi:flagellar protein FliO/FliZ